ncbi:hypothetical protein EVAR_42933_1 [Eumeta japonica]|uniref:Uncharacterized protein n=1 Tax=Eumeta variegata TaxID=151549 RepID=A0A4C1WV13_EUMVA|nr:hypothetical protein EVAR_42933_1 [Eumeta japonica]
MAGYPIVFAYLPSSSENSAGRPASLPWTKIPHCPWGGRSGPKTPITLEFTTGPNQSAVRNRMRSASGRSKIIARVTPVSSRVSKPQHHQ